MVERRQTNLKAPVALLSTALFALALGLHWGLTTLRRSSSQRSVNVLIYDRVPQWLVNNDMKMIDD